MASLHTTKQTDVKIKSKKKAVREIIIKLKENEERDGYDIEYDPFAD